MKLPNSNQEWLPLNSIGRVFMALFLISLIVNNGFIRVWNAANSGLQIPDTASGTDVAASGIKLSDIERQHIIESTYTRGEEQKLIELQEWVNGVENADKK